MHKKNLRDITDIEEPLDHLKFHEHSNEDMHLATILLLRQIARETYRTRTRLNYILAILIIVILALGLILLNENLF